MQRTIPLAVAAIVVTCFRVGAGAIATNAVITEVGIYAASVVKKFDAPGVVQGKTDGIDEFVLLTATTNIPARVGIRFGFRYTTQGFPTNAPIELTMVGVHPPLKNPKTGKTQTHDEYKLQSWIGNTYTSYCFDDTWELVHGKWRLEVWHEGKKLCEQSFLVVTDSN